MNVILFHVGKSVPNHIEICLRQFRSENPTETVWFLHNREISNEILPLLKEFNCISVVVNPNSFQIIDGLLGSNSNDFWNITMKRIPIIATFALEYKLEDIVLFENDVLIYYPLQLIYSWLVDNCRTGALLTRGTHNDIMTGFAYFSDARKLLDIAYNIIDILPEYISRKEFTNEMSLLSEYDKRKVGNIDNLPTMPQSLQHRYLCEFPYVFDPAAWGQYLCGTPHNGRQPGWKETGHFIGQALIDGIYDACFMNGKPFVKTISTGALTPLFNLHVHSKELRKYISYDIL